MSTEFADEINKHLSDIPDTKTSLLSLTDTKTSLLDASTSLLDRLLSASHVPTDGIIYQIIRDNPKLLLNPEMRRLLMRMLEAAGRHEMDNFLETSDFSQLVDLLKVTSHIHDASEKNTGLTVEIQQWSDIYFTE